MEDVQSGNGKVFECLMNHRNDQFMEPACAQILGERAALLGQNFRLSHPLDAKFSEQCQHEMLEHRRMMMSEFRMSPEVVLTCGQIDFMIYQGVLKVILRPTTFSIKFRRNEN
uniref:Uncharacterized protein n=1 Tax=Parascaris equorum TaxID=6256 RepID=A0A914S0L4_PAREQ